MKNQEEKQQEFKLEVYVKQQEESCMKELQEILTKYNCMIVPEILISPEGIQPNLKVKFVK